MLVETIWCPSLLEGGTTVSNVTLPLGRRPKNFICKEGLGWGAMSYESVLKGSVHEKSCQSAKKGGGTREGVSTRGTLKPKLATGKEDNVPPNCLSNNPGRSSKNTGQTLIDYFWRTSLSQAFLSYGNPARTTHNPCLQSRHPTLPPCV